MLLSCIWFQGLNMKKILRKNSQLWEQFYYPYNFTSIRQQFISVKAPIFLDVLWPYLVSKTSDARLCYRNCKLIKKKTQHLLVLQPFLLGNLYCNYHQYVVADHLFVWKLSMWCYKYWSVWQLNVKVSEVFVTSTEDTSIPNYMQFFNHLFNHLFIRLIIL